MATNGATIHRSPLPPAAIPDCDIASFLFASPKFSAAAAAGAPAAIDAASGDRIAFATVRDRASRLAAALHHRLAFRPWDVLAIFSPNSIHFPYIVYGTLIAGGTVTGVNPTYTSDELAHQLKESAASVLIIDKDFVASARKAAAAVGIPSSRVFVIAPEPVGDIRSIFDLLNEDRLPPTVSFSLHDLRNKPAFLSFSSGTTGLSKGVILTHRNLIANTLQVCAIEDQKHISNEVWMGVLPFYHAFALNMCLHSAPYLGIPVVVIPKFDFVLFLESVQKYRITSMHLVPPIILNLAKHPIVSKYDLSSVLRIMSGAAPLGPELAIEAAQRLNCLVTQGYGLTETSPATHICPLDDIVPGSVGVLVPNMEARIVDPDTGRDCGFEEPGELWVRGPNVMKGYLNKPDETAKVIDADGFFHTGDIAIVSLRNHFFIVDRLKELIKYKGLQVPPAELEAKLLTHPEIVDAAVISRPDLAAGELPRAYVVLKPNSRLTEDNVKAFVAERVAPFKQLRGGVVFVDAIPKAASGKILRRILRETDAKLLSSQKVASVSASFQSKHKL